MRPTEEVNQLSVEQNLHVAMETINSFAGWVMNSDTKIATLSTAQVILAVFMAAQPLGRAWPVDSPLRATALIAVLLFVISFLATVRHLGAALRPRLSPGPELNHFAFPSVARVSAENLGHEPPDCLARQAWAQVHILSVIAMARYRRFSRALTWTSLNVISVIIWLLTAGQPY